jgi:imidazolonepropionase-like amidohydrolase
MRLSLTLCTSFLTLSSFALAQQPPANGPRPVHTGWHALVHGTAVTSPGKTIKDATIVLRDGRIQSIGSKGPTPAGARIWDCTGMTIYAGFVEAYHAVVTPAPDDKAAGKHWSPKVTPQRHVLAGAGLPTTNRDELRKLGFGAVAIAPSGGIFRGTSAVVLTGKPAAGEGQRVVKDMAYQSMAFDRRGDGYPGSQMGVIAMMRQTFLDAQWHTQALAAWAQDPKNNRVPEQSDALLSLIGTRKLPFVFDTQDELELLRAKKVADEFDRQAIALGSGLEFRRIDAVAACGMPILVPVDFPDAPDVSTLALAEATSLRDLMTWEQAPTNPRRLKDKGVKIALTTARLKKPSDFFAGVRTAMEKGGLSKTDALAMITTQPAEILGVQDQLGKIAKNMIANLVIVEGELFAEKAKIRSVWVEGRHHRISHKRHDIDGRWQIVLSTANKPKAEVHINGDKVTVPTDKKPLLASKVKRKDRHLSFVIDGKPLGFQGQVALGGHTEARGWFGRGYSPEGELFQFVGTRLGDIDKTKTKTADGKDTAAKAPDTKPAVPVAITPLALPFGAYGLDTPPQGEDIVLAGGTVWTSGSAGNIPNGAVWIRDGKIAWVGKASKLPEEIPSSTRRIDTTGKHLTPGLIDCHSHTGISRGINESRQTITSEVRIGDVMNPDDIAWYRELAGGLTTVNQLHGSANPIGGQNHVAKIRWGSRHPDAMSLRGAPAGIKFALGENPKRRGATKGDRYPSTRLGVAAIIRDRFVAAREYAAAHQRHAANPSATVAAPRRDLELDALVEILDGKRLVHCHSYRQDEILMLCRLADEFGFKLGTFQHALEGYKVAEAIKKSALGASSFSDWWAYKFEVIDAIPYNGAIMHDVGVVVSFNSDSSELARRMNTEAGKAVKYGNLPPAEALKFVTINPAIQLGVEQRIGSLEKSKDADLAIWSGNPLSYRSRCEATYIDGCAYFTIERDLELRALAAKQRNRLLQAALAAKKVAKPDPGGKRRRSSRHHYIDKLFSCCEEVR